MKTKIIALVLASHAHGATLKSVEIFGDTIAVRAEFCKDHKKYNLVCSASFMEQKWVPVAKMDWKHTTTNIPATLVNGFLKLVPVDEDEQ